MTFSLSCVLDNDDVGLKKWIHLENCQLAKSKRERERERWDQALWQTQRPRGEIFLVTLNFQMSFHWKKTKLETFVNLSPGKTATAKTDVRRPLFVKAPTLAV